MAITIQDIKLYQAQDNTDNDNGGGSRTSNLIADGAVNNLFPDISRIDTTSGDVALRKIFPVIDTDNRDRYYGAHAMLRKIPEDPKVSALLFHTDDPHDVRREAQNMIEAYVVPSYKALFYLFGNHIAGSKAVTWLQRIESPLPDVGETYLLKEGSIEQYVRVGKIEDSVINLQFGDSVYQRRRIIATITRPLEHAFKGSEFNPQGQTSGTCDTFTTQIADASRFYSTKPLALDANEGNTVIQVSSMFEQLVPSTVQQTPLLNKNGLAQGEVLVAISNPQSPELQADFEHSEPQTLAYPVMPNTWRFGSYYDDGNGNIVNSSGENYGSIDYKTGTYLSTVNGGGSLYYRPASVVNSIVNNSAYTLITQENQGQVYVQNLNPMPSIPDLYIDYRSGGKWYRITCNQDGSLGNDSSIGAGNVSNNGDGTGSLSVTLGSLPDLDSAIIYSWADREAIVKPSDIEIGSALTIDLGNKNIKPESVNVTCGSVTITDNPDGTLSFDAPYPITGGINYSSGVITIETGRTLQLEDADDFFTATYEYYGEIDSNADGGLVETGSPAFTVGTDANGRTQYTGNVGAITGNDLIIKVTGFRTKRYEDGNFTVQPETIYIRNNTPDGTLKTFFDEAGTQAARVPLSPSEQAFKNDDSYLIEGTFDSSGNVSFSICKQLVKSYSSTYRTSGSYDGGASIFVAAGVPVYEDADEDAFIISSFESVKRQTNAIPTALPASTFDGTLLMGDVAQFAMSFPANMVGAITFEFGGDDYICKDGNIYRSGNQVGTINTTTGQANLAYDSLTEDIGAIETVYPKDIFVDHTQGEKISRVVSFRTSSDDLVTSSLQLRYTTVNGTFNATTDGNGVITGTDIDSALSKVDTETGAVVVVFTAAVNPSSIKYDCVAQTTLPLDPELLGLNPVRLPINGRVPIFRAGYHLVIFNEAETPVTGGTPTAGQVESLARDKQSHVEVVDVNGARLAFDQYTADRDAGTVTFADPLTLIDRNGEPMTAPFSIIDRVEDMVLCTSSDINGLMGISAPLQRDYTAGDSYVASCLVWGDQGARYYNLFSQQSFDGWFDDPTTDPITAQYDDVNYPVQIVNKDSVAGRWMIRFKSSTTVEVVEENLGVVLASVSISTTNVAPINPATGQPYWVMDFNGFGSGWVTGNIIRFNTDSGEMNAWLIRTVQSGQLALEVDAMEVEIRGDAN